MIRPAVASDISQLLLLLKHHHQEYGFAWPFDPVRLSMTLSSAMASPMQLLLIGDCCMVFASCLDSPLGAGRLAIEHIIRCELPGHFDNLLDAYETWARSKGCRESSLSCTDRHSTFARLYGRRGYQLAETTFSKAL